MSRDTKITSAQQTRLDDLQDEHGHPRIYTETVQGQTIIGQFRRYVTRQDADCIEKALYDFLMGVCGFIAEYGLIPPDGNFRLKWAEPADLIAELAKGGHAQRNHRRVERVYSDGMTDLEVLGAIDKLAAEHRHACDASRLERQFRRDVSMAIGLLAPHRFMVVPPGWHLATPNCQQPRVEEPPGTLAERLAGLAQANGLTLVAPAPVEPGGQVRLL